MRRWVNLLAIVAVLLHAGALIRHHAVMVDAQASHRALVADLATICHSAIGVGSAAAEELPFIPQPSDAQNGCPVCAGLTTAYVIAAYVALAVAPIAYESQAPFNPKQVVTSDLTETRHPPSRGPPSVA